MQIFAGRIKEVMLLSIVTFPQSHKSYARIWAHNKEKSIPKQIVKSSTKLQIKKLEKSHVSWVSQVSWGWIWRKWVILLLPESRVSPDQHGKSTTSLTIVPTSSIQSSQLHLPESQLLNGVSSMAARQRGPPLLPNGNTLIATCFTALEEYPIQAVSLLWFPTKMQWETGSRAAGVPPAVRRANNLQAWGESFPIEKTQIVTMIAVFSDRTRFGARLVKTMPSSANSKDIGQVVRW